MKYLKHLLSATLIFSLFFLVGCDNAGNNSGNDTGNTSGNSTGTDDTGNTNGNNGNGSQEKPDYMSSASAYNNHIVKLQVIVGEKMATLAENLGSQDTVLLNTLLKDVQQTADSCARIVTEMAPFNPEVESIEFLDRSRDLFMFYNNTAIGEYSLIVDIMKKPEATAEDTKMIDELVANMTIMENDIDKGFLEAQENFATSNNIVLTEPQ